MSENERVMPHAEIPATVPPATFPLEEIATSPNRARKPYDVLLLPDERHLPRRRADRVYLNERIVGYFQQHL